MAIGQSSVFRFCSILPLPKKTLDWILDADFSQQCRNQLAAKCHLVLNLLVGDANGFLELSLMQYWPIELDAFYQGMQKKSR